MRSARTRRYLVQRGKYRRASTGATRSHPQAGAATRRRSYDAWQKGRVARADGSRFRSRTTAKLWCRCRAVRLPAGPDFYAVRSIIRP